MTAMKLFHFALIGLLVLFISSCQDQNNGFGSESHVITTLQIEMEEMLRYPEVSSFDVYIEFADSSMESLSLPVVRRINNIYITHLIDYPQGSYLISSIRCKFSEDMADCPLDVAFVFTYDGVGANMFHIDDNAVVDIKLWSVTYDSLEIESSDVYSREAMVINEIPKELHLSIDRCSPSGISDSYNEALFYEMEFVDPESIGFLSNEVYDNFRDAESPLLTLLPSLALEPTDTPIEIILFPYERSEGAWVRSEDNLEPISYRLSISVEEWNAYIHSDTQFIHLHIACM